jgi:hypothetical protein
MIGVKQDGSGEIDLELRDPDSSEAIPAPAPLE